MRYFTPPQPQTLPPHEGEGFGKGVLVMPMNSLQLLLFSRATGLLAGRSLIRHLAGIQGVFPSDWY